MLLLRWIKYEEVLEPETGEWSNAHVSNLSFQSMIGLRCFLETHAILKPFIKIILLLLFDTPYTGSV